MKDILGEIKALTGKSITGSPEELKDVVMALEAKSIFDVDNWSKDDDVILKYLKDLNRIYSVDMPLPKTPKKVGCMVGISANRMPKQYGYEYSNAAYKKLRKFIKQMLYKDGITEAWTGLSQGVDICFAHAVIELRELGFPIRLCCAVAYKDFAANLKGPVAKIYENIIRRADVVEVLSNDTYSVELLQKRTEYMMDKSSNVYMVCNDRKEFSSHFSYIEGKEKTVKVYKCSDLSEI